MADEHGVPNRFIHDRPHAEDRSILFDSVDVSRKLVPSTRGKLDADPRDQCGTLFRRRNVLREWVAIPQRRIQRELAQMSTSREPRLPVWTGEDGGPWALLIVNRGDRDERQAVRVEYLVFFSHFGSDPCPCLGHDVCIAHLALNGTLASVPSYDGTHCRVVLLEVVL